MFEDNQDTTPVEGSTNESAVEDTVVFKSFNPEETTSVDNNSTSESETLSDIENNSDGPSEEFSGDPGQDSNNEPTESGETSSGNELDRYSQVLSKYGHKSIEDFASDYEALKNKASDPVSAPEETDEFVKRYKEFIDKGGEKETFMRAYSVDPSTLSAKEALRQEFLLNSPDLDKDRADRLFELEFEETYGYDEDLVDERTKELKDLKLDIAKSQAIKSLEENRELMLKTPEKPAEQQSEGPSQEEIEKFQNDYRKLANETMSNFPVSDYMIDDNKENRFVYNPNDEVKAKVNELLNVPFADPSKDPDGFMKSVTAKIFLDDSGNWDLNKATRLLSFIASPEDFVKDFAKHAMSKGEESYITGRTRPADPVRDNGFGGGDTGKDVVVFKNR